MPTDFVHTHQRGLTNEEDDPPGKRCGMNPKNEGPRHRGMKQVVIDRAPEAADHNQRQQQRHREIEIAMDQAISAGHSRWAQLCLGPQRVPGVFYVDSGHGRVSRDFDLYARPTRGYTSGVWLAIFFGFVEKAPETLISLESRQMARPGTFVIPASRIR